MVKLVTMTLSNMDREVQVQDLESMEFRSDIQPQITEWISLISKNKLNVVDVQTRILKFIRYVPEFRQLLHPSFTDSESLNIPLTLDNNYLCTIISCTPRSSYKRIVVVCPGGRQEVWELTLGKNPRSGESYIEDWQRSAYQGVAQMHNVAGGAQPGQIKVPGAERGGEGTSGVKSHMSALLGRLQSLEDV